MNKKNQDKFEEALNYISNLSLKEQKALSEILAKNLAENTAEKEIPLKYQILVSSIWFVLLATGGLLNIEPAWFRFFLLPLLGIPAGLFYVWNIRKQKYKLSFTKYCYMIFFIGPIYSLFCGIILSVVLYFPLKWIGIIH